MIGRRILAASLLGVLSSNRVHSAPADSVSDSASSASDPEPRPFLTWLAPDSCPQSEEVVERIEGLLERELPSSTPLRAQATIWPAHGFRLELILRNEEEIGTRELDFSTCEDAVNFVALSIALALGSGQIGSVEASVHEGDGRPEELGSTKSIQEAAGEDVSGGASPPDAASARMAEDSTASVAAPSTRTAEQTPTKFPVPESQKPNEQGGSAETMGDAGHLPRPFAPRSAWFAEGALALASGLLPSLGVGVLLGGGIDFSLWSVRGEGSFFPLNSIQPSGAQNRVDFGAFASHISACRVVSTEMFTLRLCAGTELALIFAEEQIQESARAPHAGTGISLGFVGGLEGLFRLRPRLSGQIQAEVAYPIVADRFALLDHSLVFDPGPGFRATFGVRYFF